MRMDANLLTHPLGLRSTPQGTASLAGVGALAVSVAMLMPAPAMAQLSFGVQAASAQKTGFGIGPRANLGFVGFEFSGDFLLFFPRRR